MAVVVRVGQQKRDLYLCVVLDDDIRHVFSHPMARPEVTRNGGFPSEKRRNFGANREEKSGGQQEQQPRSSSQL